MAYTFDKANADAPSPHKTQYFEMLGVQGLYNDGWMLSGVPIRPPWDLLGKAIQDPATAFKFELYDVRKDWTQNDDVAAAHPAKMREMTDLMFGEFAKHQVLPLDASVATRLVAPRPTLTAGRKVVHLFGRTGHRHSTVDRAELAEHLLHHYRRGRRAAGRRRRRCGQPRRTFGGYGLYFAQGQATFTWNLLDLKRVKWQGRLPLDPGKHTLVFDFKYDGLGFATLAFNNLQRHRPPRAREPVGRRQGRRDPDDGTHHSHSFCPGTRPSTSARRPARRSTIRTIRSRSPSPARSTS